MSRLESEPRRFTFEAEVTTTSIAPSQFSKETAKFAARPQPAPMAYPIEYREKALADFDEETTPVGVLLQNAKVLMKNEEYRLAAHILVDVLRRSSDNELAIRSLGECYYHLKEWEKAEKILKIAVDISPLTKTIALYADVLYGLGRNAEALNIYNEMLLDLADEEAELFKVYKAIGNIFVRQGDLEAAEENYNKAFSIDPQSDVLLVNYGTLEIQRGHIQQALERYRQALLLNDKNEKAWVGLALIHREYGDKELGWGNIQKALDLDPSNNTAIQLMADWAVKDHRLPEVIERLEKYLSINDQDSERSLLLAKLLFISGRSDLAKTEVIRATSLNPMIEGGEEFFALLSQKPTQGESATC